MSVTLLSLAAEQSSSQGWLGSIVVATVVAAIAFIVCCIIVARYIGRPLERLADAHEKANRLRDGDTAVVEALPQIRGEIARQTGAVREDVDRIDGEVNRLGHDVDRLNGLTTAQQQNIGAIAKFVDPDGRNVVIAGSEFWDNDHPGAQIQHRGVSQQQTEVLPAVTTAVVTYESPSERTGAVMAGQQLNPNRPTEQPPFNPSDRNAIWDYIVAAIQARDPQSWPWDNDPHLPADEGPYTFYDVMRARINGKFGVELPQDMHDLWPHLRTSSVWINYGPEAQHPQQ